MRWFFRNVGHLLVMCFLVFFVVVVTTSWKMGLSLIGLEIVMLRTHQMNFHEGSLLDCDLFGIGGVLLLLCGVASQGSLGWFLSTVLFIVSTQLISSGMHHVAHDDDEGSSTPWILKIVAGILLTVAFAVGLPWFSLMPQPSWQRFILTGI